MGKFGLLYLNEGEYAGEQIVPVNWVRDSFKSYFEDAWAYPVSRNFKIIGYSYQWWSARSGAYHYNLAWGHGGQLIFVVYELDMVIVTAADPLYGETGDETWNHEKAIINLVADFIASLPSE